MEYLINTDIFLEKKDIVSCNNLKLTIENVEITVDAINCKLVFSGNYIDTNNEELVINDEVPCNLLIADNSILKDKKIEKIELESLKYHIIDMRGIEIEIIFEVEYRECNEVEVLENIEVEKIEERNLEEKKEDVQVDSIKDDIYKDVEEKLATVLLEKDDNFLEEEPKRNLLFNKKTIQIIYLNENEDDSVYINNKNTRVLVDKEHRRRIIIEK